ncbi:hypothetical protein [Aquirufa ecclesiirivi]|uniref:hypothetical protein n=1 Tax=Aquirufa ecclesiirivi TaxID=2715124 RepID=UPI003BB1F1BA
MKTLKITLKERIIFLQSLPTQGSIAQIEVFEKFGALLDFSEEEKTLFELRIEGEGNRQMIFWNKEKESDTEFVLDKKEETVFKNLANAFDQNGAVTIENKSLILKLLNL